ncbi:MAG TPA: hypothetical protein VI382_03450 [Candidatus Manganitrophaceae bacterium]|nr:hypothetical protein [Candidatus Manganitrophaceae bacterium]
MAKQKVFFLPRIDVESLQPETLLFLAEERSTEGVLLDLMAKYFLTTEHLIQKIIQHPNVLDATLHYLRMFGNASYQEMIKTRSAPPGADSDEGPSAASEALPQMRETNLFQQVQQMNVAEKIQLALKGNKEARALLLKDSNKQVVLSVLSSPRLTEQEVELIASSRSVSEEILRIIAANRNWVKNYSIVSALVNNPKTPVGLSLGFLKILKAKELGGVSKNKGVPEVIRTSAHRLLQMKKGGG